MKKTRRISSFLLAGLMALSLLFTGMTPAVVKAEATGKKVVVYYTNDVHNEYLSATNKDTGKCTAIGYAKLATLKKEAAAKEDVLGALLVDCGDAIQGQQAGTLSKGKYLVDIMNATGYDFAIPGNHEFDFGMDRFLELSTKAEYTYLSCNFGKLDGTKVFDAYAIKDYDGYKVAFIGISTPETFTKSTPTYFQDAKGNYIYTFCEGNNGKDLYDKVQATVDAAKKAGADTVVAIAHLGIDDQSSPWKSEEVIANTKGIDVVLDGHSHSTLDGAETVKNKEGKDVILTSTGTKLANVGELTINVTTGTCTTKLLSAAELTETAEDATALAAVNEVKAAVEAVSKEVVAKADFKLYTKDPETGDRLVRSQETNLGDLCADAYRTMLGADIAFVNGGGIRADIKTGDVTYGDIIAVHPFGNAACLIEATGQQILDALEHSARSAKGTEISENGGFLQVSGLTYDIDTRIESTVVTNDKKEFVKVSGARRVTNVKVGGVAIDPEKTYKLASHNYMLKSGGDGYTMFKGDKILLDEVMLDNEVLINYIVEKMDGKVSAAYKNPYGEGRIRVIADETETSITLLQGTKAVEFAKVTEAEEVKVETKADGTVKVSQDVEVNKNNVVTESGVTKLDATAKAVVVDMVKEVLAETASLKDANKKTETPVVTVDMATATVVPSEVLKEAKGKDVAIVFEMGDYSWTVKGSDITGTSLADVNMKVEKGTKNVPTTVIEKVLGKDKTVVQLSVPTHGDFGFKASLTMNLGKDYAGKYANLLYYNDGKLILENSHAIAADGSTSLAFAHASDYVIVIGEEIKAPITGDATNVAAVVAILLLGVSSLAIAAKKKKDKEKEN